MMFINWCSKLKMSGPIEMQNTTVIIINITEITNVGIIGFHCAVYYSELSSRKDTFFHFRRERSLVWADLELPKSSYMCIIDPAPI